MNAGLARKFERTGLGLAMVKLLAELHGGAVAVESAAGQGSRFTVWPPFRAGDTTAFAAMFSFDRPAVSTPPIADWQLVRQEGATRPDACSGFSAA